MTALDETEGLYYHFPNEAAHSRKGGERGRKTGSMEGGKDKKEEREYHAAAAKYPQLPRNCLCLPKDRF